MKDCPIPVPTDVICGKEFSEFATAEIKSSSNVAVDDMIFDIGPNSASEIAEIMHNAGTIVWNGPVGVFELTNLQVVLKAWQMRLQNPKLFQLQVVVTLLLH